MLSIFCHLKRNTTLIRAEKLDENLAPVKIKDKQLLGSKKQIDGKFFYLFKDLEIAGKESVGNYQKHLKRNTFNIDEFNKNNQFFGVNCFWIQCWPFIRGCIYTLYDQRCRNWRNCLTFTKIFWNYTKNKSSFRNESLHNRVYKLLVTNNCDKS
nr:hypothetical protein [Mycoplasmopsis bovis]